MLQFLRIYDDIKIIIVMTIALLIVLLVSFGLRGFFKALTAYKCGDSTAKQLGRLTLNPFKHINPLGFACCLLFGFGWAEPVPINPLQFRNYKKGIALTSLSTIIVHFVLAFIGGGLVHLFYIFEANLVEANYYVAYFIYGLCYFLFIINLSLTVFNLLPIPPLECYNIIKALSSYENNFIRFMDRYGTIILLVILIAFDWILVRLIQLIAIPIELFWGLLF